LVAEAFWSRECSCRVGRQSQPVASPLVASGKPVVALLAKEWRAYRTIARRSLRRVRGRAAATSSQSRGQVVLVACVSTLFLHRLSIASRNRHALQPSR